MGTGSSQNAENLGSPAKDTGKMVQKNNNIGEEKRVSNGPALKADPWSPRKERDDDVIEVDRGIKMSRNRVDLNEVDKLQADLDKELLQGHETLVNRKGSSKRGSDVTNDVTSDAADDFDQEAEEDKILNEFHGNGRKESYPETYAEKMRREKYKNADLGGFEPVPERVIARQSKDWKVEQNIEGFDPNKFKAVNKAKLGDTDEPKTPIILPVNIEDNGANDEANNKRENNNLNYDITEEELMKDIESEFAL